MERAAVVAVVAVLALAAGGARADHGGLQPWNGANPFDCRLQYAGDGAEVPDPDADPLCIEYDKRRQNLTELGLVEFLAKEPARVALASPKCFYFQSDHWRGSVVQEDGSTKTYEWDGHYFFDKARGHGGAWVRNFSVAGRTVDPTGYPGFPDEWASYFGPGIGGLVTHGSIPVDPSCVAEARERSPYARREAAAGCASPRGRVTARRLAGVRIGMRESEVWARFGRPARVHRGFLRYCVRDGGELMAGVPERRGEADGSASARRVAFAVTTHPGITLRGVGAGDRARALRQAFPAARRWFRVGPTRVLRVRPALLAAVTRGRVRALAVRDVRRVRGKAGARGWMRRALRGD